MPDMMKNSSAQTDEINNDIKNNFQDNKSKVEQINKDNTVHQESSFMDEASKGINNTIDVASETVKAINDTVKSANDTVKAVNEVISAVTNPNSDLDHIVDEASKSIHQTIDAANETVKAATEAIKAVDNTVRTASETIGTIYTSIEEPVGEAIGKIGDKISDVLDPNQQGMMKSPLVKGVAITFSLSLLIWGLFSFFKPKQAH